jgi:hypothetical protein
MRRRRASSALVALSHRRRVHPPVVAAPSSLPPHAARLAESVSRVVRSPLVGALPSLSAVVLVICYGLLLFPLRPLRGC